MYALRGLVEDPEIPVVSSAIRAELRFLRTEFAGWPALARGWRVGKFAAVSACAGSNGSIQTTADPSPSAQDDSALEEGKVWPNGILAINRQTGHDPGFEPPKALSRPKIGSGTGSRRHIQDSDELCPQIDARRRDAQSAGADCERMV
jgi:hypothetical protein